MVEGFKEAFNEDIDQKREISFLKKLDQAENLERTKNFYVTIRIYSYPIRTCIVRNLLKKFRIKCKGLSRSSIVKNVFDRFTISR